MSYQMSPQTAFTPPDPSMLTIRDRDGSLVFWAGHAANTRMLAPPEGYAIDDAADACVYDEGCGSVKRRGFVLKHGGRETELGYGERRSFEGYVALHAGNNQEVARAGRCADWWVASSTVVLIRGSLESLNQADAVPRWTEESQSPPAVRLRPRKSDARSHRGKRSNERRQSMA